MASTASTTTTRKPRTPKDAPQRPTVTDEQYKELLAIRLMAMHGFESGDVDAATKNLARKGVRDARKVRSAQEKSGVLPAWRSYQEAQAALKVAKPRKPRATKKSATPVVTTPEPVTEPEPAQATNAA